LATVVDPAIFIKLAVPFGWMSIPGTAFCLWRVWHHGKGHPKGQVVAYRNPLSLRDAIQFALFYAFIVYLVKVASDRFGETGLSAVSAFSGLMDLDAISLSLSRMAKDPGMMNLAIQGILIATLANTLLKSGIAAVFGNGVLRVRVLPVLGVTALIGIFLIANR